LVTFYGVKSETYNLKAFLYRLSSVAGRVHSLRLNNQRNYLNSICGSLGAIMRIGLILISTISLTVSGCATPNLVVDPGSIKNTDKYVQDMKECESISKQYDLTGSTVGSAALGAGIAVGTVAAVLATGGLYLLPAGILVAGGGGAALGGGLVKGKESRARENIQAACLSERVYKAYRP
jgi:hypothetical protein